MEKMGKARTEFCHIGPSKTVGMAPLDVKQAADAGPVLPENREGRVASRPAKGRLESVRSQNKPIEMVAPTLFPLQTQVVSPKDAESEWALSGDQPGNAKPEAKPESN